MKETMPILEVKNLSVSFDKQEVLKDVSFSVDEGDVLAIIGPNGAGKSVLFRALLGLIPFGGEIKWRENAQIGYVPQKLFEKAELPLTVKEFFILKSRNLFFRDRWIIESISSDKIVLSLSFTTSTALLFLLANKTVLSFHTALAIILRTTCDFPVPGGPVITLILLEKAFSTAFSCDSFRLNISRRYLLFSDVSFLFSLNKIPNDVDSN